MVTLRPSALATALAAAAVALTACGDSKPTAQQQRKAHAAYVRDADAVCGKSSTGLTSGQQPPSWKLLVLSLRNAESKLRSSGPELHRLHERLGQSASARTKTFDAHIDALLAATRRASSGARARDAGAVRRAARGMRSAWGTLYRAAQAAGLQRCGRGGNRASDTALFTVYRHEFELVRRDVYAKLKRLRRDSASFEASRSKARRALRLLVNYRARLGRLAPPLYLRPTHRKLVRRTQKAISSGGQLQAIFDRGPTATASPQTSTVLRRYERRTEAADAVERELRRVLRDAAPHEDEQDDDEAAPSATVSA